MNYKKLSNIHDIKNGDFYTLEVIAAGRFNQYNEYLSLKVDEYYYNINLQKAKSIKKCNTLSRILYCTRNKINNLRDYICSRMITYGLSTISDIR